MLAAEAIIRQQRDHRLLLSSPPGCHHNRSSCYHPSATWREKVAQWYYDVVDRLGESRSLVYVAMNVLDRYCATYYHETSNNKVILDGRAYEIASMTSLFLAVRISGSSSSFRVQDLLSLSRRECSLSHQDVVSAGTAIVSALTWDHRVVTPSDFVAAFVEMLPRTSSTTRRQHASASSSSRVDAVLDSACYLAELAVCDGSLSGAKASDVALAAVLNAARAAGDLAHNSGGFCGFQVNEFAAAVRAATNGAANPESEQVLALRNRLHKLYSSSYDSQGAGSPHLVPDDDDDEEEMDREEEEVEEVAYRGGNFLSSPAVRSISEDCLRPSSE